MRKGINSLIGVVKEQMGADVRNGDVFIFIGASRRLMKLLHAEDGGMVMYVKRLEAGRFRIPDYDEQTRSFPMLYLNSVITSMPYFEKASEEELLVLLPHRWKEFHPEAIMTTPVRQLAR